MVRFSFFAAVLLICMSPMLAFAQSKNDAAAPLPEMPAAIKTLVAEGAQARFLGRDYGMDAWITIKNGQEQYFYVTPDHSALVMGVLFNNKGKMVTLEQVQRLQQQGDTLIDTLAGGSEPQTPADRKVSKEFETPAERMFGDIESSNWVPLGVTGAPVLYAFIDPQCPHCHSFIQSLRTDYINKGGVQVRMIPVGLREETAAQAAFLLAAPNAAERWYKHMDGDATALPANKDISDQGVQRNLAVMHAWKFDVTPLIVYRAKDGKIKILKGEPKDIPGLIADLGARG
jgi:thiol:disulfide interchange protein DsbG